MPTENPSAALADWASGLAADAIPAGTARRAGWQWASVFGAIFAGRDHPHAAALGAVARRTGGAGPSTLLPELDAVAPETAVWANAARSVLLDFDDYLFAGHTGHSAVLVALAAGELVDATGADLLAATVAANEAGGRLGAAMLTGPHNGQMWAYIHNIGGAVAAARILGLNAAATRHAIGLAMTQPPYPLPATFMGSDGKALTASGPAVDGMRAAFLAAEGFRCDVDVLADRNGFFARIHPGALSGLFSGFGQAWVTDSLSYKVYPGCAYLDTAADAVLTLVGREGMTANDVARGTVKAGLLTTGMEEMSGWYRGAGNALREINLNFSAAYSVAIALIAGRLTAAQFEPSWWEPRAAEIEDLAERIDVVLDPAMTAGMTQTHGFDLMNILAKGADTPVLEGVSFADYESRFPATVELELHDGRILSETVDIPLGGAGRPAEETRGLVRAKLEENGAPEHLFAALESLSGLSSARDIRTLVTPTP
jgi:2-methylcitrate dehydratase PrpD